MASIQKLNPDLINKIAAGEVVERPANVVKELIENSIDAEADRVLIDIKNGGFDLIAVQDNGMGMSQEDALLSVKTHTTSKLNSIEDLNTIQTLGFRGEALASISSVSQFSLETREKHALEGTKIIVTNGQTQVEPCGCAEGTKITIKNIFYNVPARRKFLKTPQTEYQHILDTITHFCLIYPGIEFKLSHNGKTALQVQKTSEWQQRIRQVLGTDISNELLDIEAKGTIGITGFVGKPVVARNNRKSQYIFVNNRVVDDFKIATAIKKGFGTLIPRELHPVFVVNILIPYELVDVNIHPRKAEVRFKPEYELFQVLQANTKKILEQHNLTPQISLNPQGVDLIDSNIQASKPPLEQKVYSMPKSTSTPNLKQVSQSLEFSKQILDSTQAQESIEGWTLLGQIHNAYIIVESQDGLIIIDQHAAAERVLYERFKHEPHDIKTQKLLVPQNIELSIKESETLKASLEIIREIGFDIEEFGENAFIINGVPQDFANMDIQKTILHMK